MVHQVKDSGEEKDRATTDAGARRQESTQIASARQHRVQIGQANVDGMVKAAQAFTKSFNAKPGEDSPNACISDETFLPFRWGQASQLAKATDILLASGLKVDIVLRDFKGWYEQWARANTDHHLCGQLVSDSMEWDTQVCFGWSDAAHLLPRANFVVLHIIEVELEEAQAVFGVTSCGMSEAEQSALEQWTATRHAVGQKAQWWSCLPFFDDNSIACLSLCKKWTGVVESVIDAVWKKYNYQISAAKSAVNYYDNDHWEAILGRVLHTRRRQTILPQAKVTRYSSNVDDVIAAAEAHRTHLVDKTSAQQLFGRLLFACDAGVPSIWRDFIALMSCVCSSWSSHWIQLEKEARDILQHIQ